MKKILFPTDFSKTAKNGFEYALKLAEAMDATVDIMNVYNISFSAAEGMPAEFIQDMLHQKKVNTEEKLTAFAEGADANFSGEKIPVYGVFIPEEVISRSKLGKYDLIVMGTKGEHNSVEKLVGSITTRTMMNASCPVLAIPEDAVYKNIEDIVYATNFTPTDTVAVQQLMQFSSNIGAVMKFVHVETEPSIGAVNDTILLENFPFKFTEFTILNNESVMEGLDNYIEKESVDLLALFIPKRRLWERLFHRSFSKKYAFHTKVPLLVFHE